jgi:hypothetical protein
MVCGNATAVCGWNELFNGHLVGAAFGMYDAAFIGWTVAILFFVYQFMLYIKTRNMALCWITGIFFISMYVGLQTLVTFSVVRMESVYVMFILLVFELAGILFVWLWK